MNRRQIITVTGLLLSPAASGALRPTPAQTAGPFYPDALPLDDDNDLVRVTGQARPARGTVLQLAGHVFDRSGVPVPEALVEIWQCDANGRYHHPRDRRDVAPDPGFQGYGRTVTVQGGAYRFRTIRPVAYPGRTPHIHFAVTAPDDTTLVTQLYVDGEPGNEQDLLYRRIPPALRPLVTVPLAPQEGSSTELGGRFDIVLPG